MVWGYGPGRRGLGGSKAERIRREIKEREKRAAGPLGQELAEHEREERELQHLDAEGNEAHAPAGQACARCGALITVGEDARMRVDHRWVHEACP
jgi:hypothetical protein